jgi:hypothetical protein
MKRTKSEAESPLDHANARDALRRTRVPYLSDNEHDTENARRIEALERKVLKANRIEDVEENRDLINVSGAASIELRRELFTKLTGGKDGKGPKFILGAYEGLAVTGYGTPGEPLVFERNFFVTSWSTYEELPLEADGLDKVYYDPRQILIPHSIAHYFLKYHPEGVFFYKNKFDPDSNLFGRSFYRYYKPQ